jgi:hypothetical protein
MLSLASSTIVVHDNDVARVKLRCRGTSSCTGKLLLRAKSKPKKDTQETIGEAAFSISGGKVSMVEFKLDAAGRTQLKATHWHLRAALTITESASAVQTTTDGVKLVGPPAVNTKKSAK